MKVYRIENSSGWGPYTGGHINGRHAESFRMPLPFSDFSGYEYIKYREWDDKAYFAMPSMKSLFQFWRYQTRVKLLKEGYVINVYDIDDSMAIVSDSQLQVAFLKDQAVKVSTHSLVKGRVVHE